jgi:23S rRNA (cytidine2498-2'-O)-methyltransferase
VSSPWLWTTRPGFEADLVAELTRRKLRDVRVVGPSLVGSQGRPREFPVFARTGFPIGAEGPADPIALANAAAGLLPKKPFLVLPWVPDADAENPHAPAVEALARAVVAALPAELESRRVEGAEAARYGGSALQICLAGGVARLGVIEANELPTLAPGGRVRAAMPKDAPSRAGRKLEEALAWVGRGPEAGDVCVDLGAAPGGWTAVILQKRAQVIAVDPALLAPAFKGRKGLVHVKASAFEFAPNEAVDWLFCDMAWRPLEVAQLLAKWGRKKWAHALVANVKLPMKQRIEHVDKVLETVIGGGWQNVRARHLYHDREEVTLSAWRAGY